jgi:hypothetical protein
VCDLSAVVPLTLERLFFLVRRMFLVSAHGMISISLPELAATWLSLCLT